MSAIKSTVAISDDLMICKVSQTDNDRFTIRQKNDYDGTRSEIKVYDAKEARTLANELLLWASTQG